ncbi:hypothetical protein C2G38_2043320 [Gigaspora rosea]|uniref:TLDc domain-containing protein n=1 Tax=Gigaspora rosea TaxID=44941 RepID=A0A397UK45_9GLOM|nr:hypothetical protein C2G38_2043320 [Gigaspora rosea]
MPIFSEIINEEHAAEIASWIDEKLVTYSVENNPYNIKLLIRGNKNDFTPESFWNVCDKQANTVLIMKVENTDEILGGYNPIERDKTFKYWRNCNNSFIFSLKNNTIQSSILSRVKDTDYAIYCDPSYGPCFGGGFDICVVNNFVQCWCRHSSY